METALSIVNDVHDIDLPLARTAGLTGLGGARLKLGFADHQADPQKGRAEAERLITQDKVAAIIGTYHSSVAAVASQVCERYGVPFVAAESSSPSLHRRGMKFFFRPGPHDEMFSEAMFKFMDELARRDKVAISQVGLFYEDTLFGTDSSAVQRKIAGERGIKLVADVKYRANSPSLTSEVQQLKSAGTEIVLATSYTSDAILFLRTMEELGFKPKAIVAQDAGYVEPTFLSAVGSKAEGLISRSSFSLDLASVRPALTQVNKLYRERSGKDMTDNTARAFTAMMVLADAINRAGSPDGERIRAALAQTDIPGTRTIMPWPVVHFDAMGQNTDATPIMVQHQAGSYHTVWPFDLAKTPVEWPMKGSSG